MYVLFSTCFFGNWGNAVGGAEDEGDTSGDDCDRVFAFPGCTSTPHGNPTVGTVGNGTAQAGGAPAVAIVATVHPRRCACVASQLHTSRESLTVRSTPRGGSSCAINPSCRTSCADTLRRPRRRPIGVIGISRSRPAARTTGPSVKSCRTRPESESPRLVASQRATEVSRRGPTPQRGLRTIVDLEEVVAGLGCEGQESHCDRPTR